MGYVDVAWHFVQDFNNFEVDNTTRTRPSGYVYRHMFEFERIDVSGQTTAHRRLWYHSITVSVLYYMLVRLVRRLMADRPPFRLRTPLIVWNAGLALFSFVCLLRFSEELSHKWFTIGPTFAICHLNNLDGPLPFWSLAFAYSKVVELGDTLFIVLRKRPLIFLHYYHHAAVLVYAFHSLVSHAAPSETFAAMNALAHSLMYSYYAACAIGYRMPKWVAMTVTTVQTVQMLVGVLISCFVYRLKVYDQIPCQQSMANLYLAFGCYITFAILFMNYFWTTYVRTDAKKWRPDAKKIA